MKEKSKGSRELLKSGTQNVNEVKERGYKMWQENRKEGVSLKERVNEKTRESQPKTQTKKINKRPRDGDFQKENLRNE